MTHGGAQGGEEERHQGTVLDQPVCVPINLLVNFRCRVIKGCVGQFAKNLCRHGSTQEGETSISNETIELPRMEKETVVEFITNVLNLTNLMKNYGKKLDD